MAAKAKNSVSLQVGPAATAHLGDVVTQVFGDTTAIDLVGTSKIPSGTAFVRLYCAGQAVSHFGTGDSAAATGIPCAASGAVSYLLDVANTDHFWVAPAAAATVVIELHAAQEA